MFQRNAQIATRVAFRFATAQQEEDKSTNPTVVEYAVQYLFKGKSPATAAKETAKKLSGSENLFLGPGITSIDPKKLEAAIWDRLVEFTITNLKRNKAGFEHYALNGTILNFRQKPQIRAELKKRVIKEMGHDPFPNDTVV